MLIGGGKKGIVPVSQSQWSLAIHAQSSAGESQWSLAMHAQSSVAGAAARFNVWILQE